MADDLKVDMATLPYLIMSLFEENAVIVQGDKPEGERRPHYIAYGGDLMVLAMQIRDMAREAVNAEIAARKLKR